MSFETHDFDGCEETSCFYCFYGAFWKIAARIRRKLYG